MTVMGNKTVDRKLIKYLKAPLFCHIVMKNIYRLGEENSASQGIGANFLDLADMFITFMRLKF